MAHSEACQLYIEQYIQEGLAEQKTPHAIAKELGAEIERVFEVVISKNTLKARAWRMQKKGGANAPTPPTPENHEEIQENQSMPEETPPLTHEIKSEIPKNQKGGPRPGAGRPAKFKEPGPAKPPEPSKRPKVFSDAMDYATIAISQLSRIRAEDPKREKAFKTVLDWIENNKGGVIIK